MAEAYFSMSTYILGRRQIASSLLLAMLFAATPDVAFGHDFDVSDSAPPLTFTMTDATNGKQVTAADFRGKVVMLYLGYTQCPDVCPLTLHNVADILHRLGNAAGDVRVLFVTVDPNRDSLPLLKEYTAAFAPQIVGLRGNPDELARLARRYRLAYSVSPATRTHPYEVMHSSGIYVFGRNGYAKLLVTSMASATPDLSGTAADLQRLLRGRKQGMLANLLHLF
jgi:protein SCO1/2